MSGVLLERAMQLGESPHNVIVQIEQPTAIRAGEVECRFTISHGAEQINGAVYGADAIQSIMIAFDALRQALLDEFPSATWQGLSIEISFPRAIPYVAGLDTYREIENLVDRYLNEKFGVPNSD